jgi:hypothetical protein
MLEGKNIIILNCKGLVVTFRNKLISLLIVVIVAKWRSKGSVSFSIYFIKCSPLLKDVFRTKLIFILKYLLSLYCLILHHLLV